MEEPIEDVGFRSLNVTDAAAFADFLPLLDAQSEFMLYEPGERGDFGIEESRAKIAAESCHGVLIGAFASAQHLVGYVSAQGSALHRIRHVLYLVLGVLPAYGHHGIGTELLGAVERWGLAHGICRLELTVVRKNAPAIGLYAKCGFQVEGVRHDSIRIEDSLCDELYMAKTLGLQSERYVVDPRQISATTQQDH